MPTEYEPFEGALARREQIESEAIVPPIPGFGLEIHAPDGRSLLFVCTKGTELLLDQ